MTDEPIPEQTVLDVAFRNAGVATTREVTAALEDLGIDPDLPVSVLRERLRIGARAQACEADGYLVRAPSVEVGWATDIAPDLLAWLRGDR